MEGGTKLSVSLKSLRKYLDEADEGGATGHLAKLLREHNKLGWFGVGNATKALDDGEMFTLNCPLISLGRF